MNPADLINCSSCSAILNSKYIQCAECTNVTLCPPCFARGVQTDTHKNSHKYSVVQPDIHIHHIDWTLGEELKLLDHLIEFGYGSWDLVTACALPHKTPAQIKQHFETYYVPKMQFSRINRDQRNEVAVPYVMTGPLEQPRRPPRAVGSVAELAHYNPARGEFNEEYDNAAERILDHLEIKEEGLLQELNLAIADMYIRRLSRRARVHRLVRDYGLISRRKQIKASSRYKEVQYQAWNPEQRSVLSQLLQPSQLSVFSQLLAPSQFDYLLEGLLLESNIKIRILKMQALRAEGMRSMESAQLKHSLNLTRDNHASELASSDRVACLVPHPGAAKKRSGPASLSILGYPGYERLTDEERGMCSNIRLLPETYLSIRTLLESESLKGGGLRLAEARSLLKIDVNKTRKIYDFLVEQSTIKPKQ